MKSRTERLREMFRFVQVGVASNLAYFSVLALLHWLLGMVLWLAAALAYAVSMVVNYLLHHRHTFRSAERHSRAVFKYGIVQLGMLATNSAVLHLIVTVGGASYVLGQIVAIGLVTAFSYLLGRRWVFSSSNA